MKKIVFLLLISIVFLGKAEKDSVKVLSPRDVVTHHIKNLSHDHFYPELAVACFDTAGLSFEEAQSIAVKLKQYYRAKGYFIDFNKVPDDPNYRDTILDESIFYPIAEEKQIYIVKNDGKWMYAKETVENIEAMHKSVFPFGTHLLLEFFKKRSEHKILGLYYWQYFGLLLLGILAYLIYAFWTFIFGKLLFRFINKWNKVTLPQNIYMPLAKTLSMFIVLVFLSTFVVVLQLPIHLSQYVQIAFKVLVPFSVTYICYRMIDFFSILYESVSNQAVGSLERQLVPLIRKVAKVLIFLAGVIYILQNLSFNITTLLAGISIGGLAFALAAQDTLKNLFGSLMIFLDKPFKVGDWVTSGDIDGTVEEVGFRSTRIRTFRNSLVYVPNAKIADATIDNHGLREFRRFYTKIGIEYNTPVDKINNFVDDLRKMVMEHPHTRKENFHIYLNDFSSSTLQIMFYIFFKAPDWGKELQYRHEMMTGIIELAEKNNVKFAFPTQTLHLESVPNNMEL